MMERGGSCRRGFGYCGVRRDVVQCGGFGRVWEYRTLSDVGGDL